MSDLFALPTTATSDAAVADLAARLLQTGRRVIGAVQHGAPDGMVLRAVCGTELWPITQRLGSGAQGCTLDPGALEHAVARVSQRLPGADLLIVNRFGKQEAAGRGFAPLIATALGQGTGVVISVPPAHLAAFNSFAGDLACWTDPARLWIRLLQPA